VFSGPFSTFLIIHGSHLSLQKEENNIHQVEVNNMYVEIERYIESPVTYRTWFSNMDSHGC
jgi:hypothetical protein